MPRAQSELSIPYPSSPRSQPQACPDRSKLPGRHTFPSPPISPKWLRKRSPLPKNEYQLSLISGVVLHEFAMGAAHSHGFS